MTKRSSKRQARKKATQKVVLSEAQMALGWFVILALVALLGTIYLSQASRIARTGREMQTMQDELEVLKRQNAELERIIAEGQSLVRMEEGVRQLGFIPAGPEDIEYLVVTDYPGAPTPAPTATLVPTPPVETMEEAVWLTVRDSVSNLVTGRAGEQ